MFDLPDLKSFMDNVHGYIRIPKVFVKHIIDTPDFQRLRNIDQTGMKILFPAAKHDRFSHSLGVFHLGTITVDALLKNFQDNSHWKIRSDRTRDIFWAKNKVLFLIACLLHDIGHTPFSHSLEQFYGFKSNDPKTTELLKLLKITIGNAMEEDLFYRANEHEKMSAFLILRERRWKSRIGKILDDLEDKSYPKQVLESDGEYDNIPQHINRNGLDDDIRFIARMILGVKYSDYRPEMQIRNCFIELLNGNFDVDKLDYTVRDTVMSGISNTNIDIERLLKSLTIIPTTVYVNTDVDIDISPAQSLIITQMTPSENKTFFVKGSFDRDIPLQNCTISFPKGTKINHLYPKQENISTGISADGAKVSNNSIVFLNHQLLSNGTQYTTIPTTANNHLELKDTIIVDEWNNVKVGNELYYFSFDSTNAEEALCIATHDIEIEISNSINFSGSLKGHFKRFEILCDKLVDECKLPTETIYTGFSVGFKKQAINLISNVTDARNYLYLWIYSHHKVIYYANYLIIELARLSVPKQNDGQTLKELLIDMILNSKTTYMLDEDFIHAHIRNAFKHPDCSRYNCLFNELSSRRYRSSLYKSLAEFDLIFEKFDDIKKQKMRDRLEGLSIVLSEEEKPQILSNDKEAYKLFTLIDLLRYGEIRSEVLQEMEFEGKKLSDLVEDIIWVSSNPSLKRPSPSTIYIKFNNKEKPVTTMDRLSILKLENLKSDQKYYFFLYYQKKVEKHFKELGKDSDKELKKIITRAFVGYMEKLLRE